MQLRQRMHSVLRKPLQNSILEGASRERSGELMAAMRVSSADWSIVGGLRRGQRRDNWLGKHWRGLLRLGPA
jgi:hypothetical protein